VPFLNEISEATVCVPESWAISKPSIREGRGKAELLPKLLEGGYVAQLAAALGEVLFRVMRR